MQRIIIINNIKYTFHYPNILILIYINNHININQGDGMKRLCKTCEYFEPLDENNYSRGWCKRYPPVLYISNNMNSYEGDVCDYDWLQPEMNLFDDRDWCGEWREKPCD